MEKIVFKTDKNMNTKFPVKIFENKGKFNQVDHSHEYLQIWYVRRGKCKNYLNGYEYNYSQGGICIIPPFVEHRIENDDETSVLICCEFSERFINEALQYENRDGLFDIAYLEPFFLSENMVEQLFKISDDKLPFVDKIFSDLLREYNTYRKHSYLFIKADLLKLLATIASEYDARGNHETDELFEKYRDAIDRAICYINENYNEKIYLEEACRIAMMSTSTFSYIFKQVTGKTFSEYVMNLRLRHAAELLRDTQTSLVEICEICGFSDSNYFSRVFKKSYGMPPSQFRRAMRE